MERGDEEKRAKRIATWLPRVQRGDWYGLIDCAGRFVWGPTTEGRVSRVVESAWA